MSLIPKSRRGAGWRFFAAGFLLIVLAAATTAVAGLLKFHQFAVEIGHNQPISGGGVDKEIVDLPPAGAPQTILVVGSDHRVGEPYQDSNTDTMMLVRLDANSSTINVISVPRDLQVDIPGHGIAKLNAAYQEGGWGLLIKTLKSQVFPGLVVNHLVDLNFGTFEKLVDAIGCVYGDVDHRYYNNTAYTDYSSIDVQPGYQKLCNVQALQFVRFRHTDSDITRNARQQDFIRWAKDNYSADQLLANATNLLTIFGKNAQVDRGLHSALGLQSLFDLVVRADGHTIKTIPFPYTFGACDPGGQTPCYVFSTAPQEDAAFRQFLTPTSTTVTPTSGVVVAKTSRKHHHHAPSTLYAGLMPDPTDGDSQANQLGRVGMPVYFPNEIVANSYYCFFITGVCPTQGFTTEFAHSYPRNYQIHGIGGAIYKAYVMTIAISPAQGRYYTVQGTTWQNPPILRNPTETQKIHGKKLLEFFNGGEISLVAWRTPHGVYWISNTLDDYIPNKQMVGMAASFTAYHG